MASTLTICLAWITWSPIASQSFCRRKKGSSDTSSHWFCFSHTFSVLFLSTLKANNSNNRFKNVWLSCPLKHTELFRWIGPIYFDRDLSPQSKLPSPISCGWLIYSHMLIAVLESASFKPFTNCMVNTSCHHICVKYLHTKPILINISCWLHHAKQNVGIEFKYLVHLKQNIVVELFSFNLIEAHWGTEWTGKETMGSWSWRTLEEGIYHFSSKKKKHA